MKIKGSLRAVDELGRIVVPIDYRKALGISAGDLVDISLTEDGILIKKLKDTCYFCGADELLTQFKGKAICLNCLKEIAKEYN